MNFKTAFVFVSISAAVIFADSDVNVKVKRLSMPKLNASCNIKDITATCCASVELSEDNKKTACISFKVLDNQLAVDVNVVYNNNAVGSFTLGPKTAPVCLPTPAVKLCLSLKDVKFAAGYAKICSALEAHALSANINYKIPCLEYKNKKFSVLPL